MKKIFTLLALLLAFQCVYSQTGEAEKVLMKPALLVIDVQKQFLPMMPGIPTRLNPYLMPWILTLSTICSRSGKSEGAVCKF